LKLKAYKSEEDENIVFLEQDIYTVPIDIGSIQTYCNYEYSPFHINGIEADIIWRAIKACSADDTVDAAIAKINEVEL
jgi:hypothetical protein